MITLNEENNDKFCKRLIYRDESRRHHILLGIVIEEDKFFLRFKTRSREIWVSKKHIVSITATDEKYDGEENAESKY